MKYSKYREDSYYLSQSYPVLYQSMQKASVMIFLHFTAK